MLNPKLIGEKNCRREKRVSADVHIILLKMWRTGHLGTRSQVPSPGGLEGVSKPQQNITSESGVRKPNRSSSDVWSKMSHICDALHTALQLTQQTCPHPSAATHTIYWIKIQA